MQRLVDPDSFGFLITDISRMIRAEMDRRVAQAELGITAGEARTLAHAARAGAVRQNVLAERMGIEAMTLSTYVDRLEARGLVTRTTDPTDRRAKRIELTPPRGRPGDRRRHPRQGIAFAASDDWDMVLETLKTVRTNLSQVRAAGKDAA